MEGLILHYRQGAHTQYGNHMIVHFAGVADRESAVRLFGKKVVWTSPAGKQIAGQVHGAHGNKGVVRVLFEKGMPGQAIGTFVKLV